MFLKLIYSILHVVRLFKMLYTLLFIVLVLKNKLEEMKYIS